MSFLHFSLKTFYTRILYEKSFEQNSSKTHKRKVIHLFINMLRYAIGILWCFLSKLFWNRKQMEKF